MPLGLFHDDHIAASDAAIDAARRRPRLVGLVYADAIYRPLPDLLDHRLRALADAGFVLREVCVPRGVASDRKRRAVACYASQVRALACSWESGVADAFEPERYWQIAMPAASATAPGRWAAEGGPDGDGC
jgi:LmbE family N-acetylglucosaminyl deacetylase